MAIIYREIGPLSSIKQILKSNNINDFKSLKELNNFLANYENELASIKIEHSKSLKKELEDLRKEFELKSQELEKLKNEKQNQIQNEINEKLKTLEALEKKPFSFINFLTDKFQKDKLRSRINYLKNNSQKIIYEHNSYLISQLNKIESKLSHLSKNFDKVLLEQSKKASNNLLFKYSVISNLSPLISGAIGENKTLTELKNLNDDYIIINDVNIEFPEALYNAKTDEYINSIQLDHVVISQSGIFIIETKNWNKSSIDNKNYSSPVSQIKRSGYAFYTLLHNSIENGKINIDRHHWGDRKIGVKNIISLIGDKPNEDFQHVKLLNYKDIVSYIKYFEPVLTKSDTQALTKYILNICNGYYYFDKPQKNESYNHKHEKKKHRGFCIRCAEKIRFNPNKPYCIDCFIIWEQFENPHYSENVCHDCGKNTFTTFLKPLCTKCYVNG
jgi:hypothetical protein